MTIKDKIPNVKGPVFPAGEARGRLMGRAIRYGVVASAGYLFGVSVSRMALRTPGFWPLVLIAAVGAFLLFRQGAKSQSHAAADAISSANARAAAVAVAAASQVVNVNSGNTVSADPLSAQIAEQPHTPLPVEQSSYVDAFEARQSEGSENARRLYP
nr:MAG TPA: hypothetical protein [Inoviridae sp.]